MIAILIPARIGSTRFPKKPLAKIKGKHLIQWVCEGIKKSRLATFKAVLTDSYEIKSVVEQLGIKAFIVKGRFNSGTDRIAYFAKDKDFEYIVNVQGDEPLIDDKIVDELIEYTIKNKDKMSTIVSKISEAETNDNNIVKVVTDRDGYAMYFSRSKIPFNRNNFNSYLRHIGVYMYSKSTLMSIYNTKSTQLETAEGLEQLRALEMGIKIRTFLTRKRFFGVDKPDDILGIGELLEKEGGNNVRT